MPNVLESVVANRRFRFGDNLRVQEINATGAIARETDWASSPDAAKNEIAFRFGVDPTTTLAVKYAFNDRNQLTLQIPLQPGVTTASAAWILPGKISIDDVTDVGYELLTVDGDLTGKKLVVRAKLDFPQGHATLRAKFPDGSESVITGAKPAANLSSAGNPAGGDLTRDLLAFNAFTRNTVDGAVENLHADVKFFGRWDLHENALVFVTHYDSTGTGKPQAYVALAGEIKGTNFGLVLDSNGAALQIYGRYNWNKNTLGWDLDVGYSKSAGIQAHVAADAKFAAANGALTLQGGATLKKGDQGLNLKLDLKVDYTTQGGHLVFKLQVDGSSYEVQLSGDFQIKNGYVKFTLSFASKNGQKIVQGTLDLGYFNTDSNLKLSLEAVLGPNGLTLKLDMEFRYYWGPNGPVAELP